MKLDADGKATVSFDIPQFNGTSASWRSPGPKDAVGHASPDVVVRDPVVVTASLPRFLAPGDKAELRLDIANTDGPAGDYSAVARAGDGVGIGSGTRQTLTLAPGKRQTLTVRCWPASSRRRRRHRSRLGLADGLVGSNRRCAFRCARPPCRSPPAPWSTSPATAAA